MFSTGNKDPCISVSSKFHLLSSSSVFDSFCLKLSLIVILTNFSYSLNSSKLPACENMQFYSIFFHSWGIFVEIGPILGVI